MNILRLGCKRKACQHEHLEKVQVSLFHSTPPPDIDVLRNVKVLDASQNIFNEIGIAAITFLWSTITTAIYICEGRWYVTLSYSLGPCSSDGRKGDPGPGINTQVVAVADDCKPTRIMSTTSFIKMNVSVVAPYFGNLEIKDSSSEASKGLILTVKRYVYALRY
jgi:hypothetical protein